MKENEKIKLDKLGHNDQELKDRVDKDKPIPMPKIVSPEEAKEESEDNESNI